MRWARPLRRPKPSPTQPRCATCCASAALAHAAAEAGLIPARVPAIVDQLLRSGALRSAVARRRRPPHRTLTVPLVKALTALGAQARRGGGGRTTLGRHQQDVLDTAMVLQLARPCRRFEGPRPHWPLPWPCWRHQAPDDADARPHAAAAATPPLALGQKIAGGRRTLRAPRVAWARASRRPRSCS